MSRPLRIEYKGARYHVMNRGNQRGDVFKHRDDCEIFLEKLAYFAELFNVDINCYCLMPNHFHLLLRTNESNLSRFMQSFLTSFTVTLNRRNKKSGHIFRGRFKSHLIQNRKYLSTVSRYVHLNPVRIKSCDKLSVEDKRRMLEDYPWSSYKAHIGLCPKADFLDINTVLSTWGRLKQEKMENYRKYIDEGLYKGVTNPFDPAVRGQIVGSESFAEKILREQLLNKEIKDSREERELFHFKTSIEPDKIIELTAKFFHLDEKELLRYRSPFKTQRKVAMYLCCRYCTSNMSLSNIGSIFGVSLSGLTRSRDRLEEELKSDKDLKSCLIKIKKSIAEV